MDQYWRNEVERERPNREHDRIREMLPEYAMIRAGGKLPGPEWRGVEEHLAYCESCGGEVAELSDALIDTYTGKIAASPIYPEPDLSFLPTRHPGIAPAGQPGHPGGPVWADAEGSAMFDHVRRLIIQFTEALLDVLRQPDLAGGFRESHNPGAPHEAPYCSYQHPRHADDDLHVTIDVSVTDDAHKLCRVLVSVVDPRDPFDQEGRTVILRFGTFTRDSITDHQGYASFANIPLESISQVEFTIAPRRTH